MSGLREALIEQLEQLLEPYAEDADAVPPLAASWADAVLRVLAEHGDTQQVRAEIEETLSEEWHSFDMLVGAVMFVVAPIVAARDAAVDDVSQEIRWRERAIWRAERAEADLAAARQQLDAVRALADEWEHGALRWAEPLPVPPEVAQIRAILDAPARPAGHDESGQR